MTFPFVELSFPPRKPSPPSPLQTGEGAQRAGEGVPASPNRQVDAELRPGAGRRLHHHGPAVVLGDNEVRHRETQPGANSRRLRGEERLEGAAARLRVHARSVVLHLQVDVVAGIAYPHRDAGRLRPGVEHRVGGVLHQVEDHLLNLGGDAGDLRHVAPVVADDIHVPEVEVFFQVVVIRGELQRPVHDLRDVLMLQ